MIKFIYKAWISPIYVCLIYINEKWLNEYECLNSDNNICLDTTVFYNIISNVSKNQSIVISNTKNDDSCEINLINDNPCKV